MKRLRTAKLSDWREIAPWNVISALGWYAQHDAKRVAYVINVGATDPNVWLGLSDAIYFIEHVVNKHITLSDMHCLLKAVLSGVDPIKAWNDWEYTQREE